MRGYTVVDATTVLSTHLTEILKNNMSDLLSYAEVQKLLKRYLASRLGVFSFLTPLFGMLFGVWLLAEPLEASFVAGTVLVLAGVAVVSGYGWWRQRRAGAAG